MISCWYYRKNLQRCFHIPKTYYRNFLIAICLRYSYLNLIKKVCEKLNFFPIWMCRSMKINNFRFFFKIEILFGARLCRFLVFLNFSKKNYLDKSWEYSWEHDSRIFDLFGANYWSHSGPFGPSRGIFGSHSEHICFTGFQTGKYLRI